MTLRARSIIKRKWYEIKCLSKHFYHALKVMTSRKCQSDICITCPTLSVYWLMKRLSDSTDLKIEDTRSKSNNIKRNLLTVPIYLTEALE
jgi:hypothetical protein